MQLTIEESGSETSLPYFLSDCFTLIQVARAGISQVSMNQLAKASTKQRELEAHMMGIASKSCPAKRFDRSSSDMEGV